MNPADGEGRRGDADEQAKDLERAVAPDPAGRHDHAVPRPQVQLVERRAPPQRLLALHPDEDPVARLKVAAVESRAEQRHHRPRVRVLPGPDERLLELLAGRQRRTDVARSETLPCRGAGRGEEDEREDEVRDEAHGYSTVTLFARLRGRSTSHWRRTAMW